MNTPPPSPELLKRAVIELIDECRRQLAEGVVVDVSEVERGVRTYCTAIAALPLDKGRAHTQDLRMMMQVMAELSDEMVAARDAVRGELEALGRLRQASNAYQKSDAIGGKRKKNEKKS